MSEERYLSPRVLQILGVVLLIGAAVFWAVTGRQSALIMSAAMSLIGLGAYRSAQEALRKPAEQPTPPPPGGGDL